MQNNVAFLANDVGRLFRKRFNVAARRLGVTGAQWRMLATIRRTPGMSQRALADWLEVEAITVGRMLDRLEKAGLVERHDDPADRRSWRLYLTAEADRQMDQLTGFAAEVFAEALCGISPDEQAQMLELLERVRANLAAVLPDEADVPAPLRRASHG